MNEFDAKAAKAAYQREYYRKNREKIRKYQNAYWERRAKRLNENSAEQPDEYTDGKE
jgi:hypothetical protein